MKKTKIFAMTLAMVLAVTSCKDDDNVVNPINPINPEPAGAFQNGIIVANEGNFGTPNADVSFIDANLDGIQNNVYTTTNNENLGDVLQNIGFTDDDAFLVANNSNRIAIVDRYTMEFKSEITEGLSLPRYITFAGDYAYVTNSSSKTVSIYNKDTYNYIESLNINNTVERIVTCDSIVFVQNASFGSGNSLTMISTNSNQVKGSIDVPAGSIDRTVSYNNKVYVIARTDQDSYIYTFDSLGTLLNTITLTGIPKAKNLDIDQDKFYFTSGTGVYAMSMTDSTAPTAPIFNVEDNSWSTFYGFNVIDGKIYVSDAQGFTQGSKVTVYNTSGELLKEFTATIGVNAFYKN
ncbi:MAG: hypothetical protein Q4B43_04215 [Bacteroidota bacterium]|nr:hypothetical protein [Bacteroidota bacterium]